MKVTEDDIKYLEQLIKDRESGNTFVQILALFIGKVSYRAFARIEKTDLVYGEIYEYVNNYHFMTLDKEQKHKHRSYYDKELEEYNYNFTKYAIWGICFDNADREIYSYSKTTKSKHIGSQYYIDISAVTPKFINGEWRWVVSEFSKDECQYDSNICGKMELSANNIDELIKWSNCDEYNE